MFLVYQVQDYIISKIPLPWVQTSSVSPTWLKGGWVMLFFLLSRFLVSWWRWCSTRWGIAPGWKSLLCFHGLLCDLCTFTQIRRFWSSGLCCSLTTICMIARYDRGYCIVHLLVLPVIIRGVIFFCALYVEYRYVHWFDAIVIVLACRHV